eukprot:CAMPEP_0170412096 /NCGR_PEP_ID=MMETSP0117_2-20130122/30783_1 /TAXON_ID=400756 /ORGANISM="Durinskia baltica, Strain CSIRO CS-38" /LENGTH=36 /DNA_ID= /DNA_START= /DNA_END= /DNA_ORIENTATION=
MTLAVSTNASDGVHRLSGSFSSIPDSSLAASGYFCD